jgi:predicted RNA-binding protein
VLEDRHAKGDALLAVLQRGLERRTRHADALAGDADAAAFQPREGDLQALAFGAEAVARRDAAVVEIDLRGVRAVLA